MFKMTMLRSLIFTSASFCILLISYTTPLDVTYHPSDANITSCSGNYTLFVGSNFSATVDLSAPGGETFQFQISSYSRVIETRSYTATGPGSPVLLYHILDTVGTYNLTITTATEGEWRKEIRVTDSTEYQIQEVRLTQTSAMPGELITGTVSPTDSTTVVNDVHYVWYFREKRNTPLKPPWLLIGTGKKLEFHFNQTRVYELIVAKSVWQNLCRRSWTVQVYVTASTFSFGPSTIPLKGRSRDITCSVHNSSQPGDVIWKYGGVEMTACRSRSRIVRTQSFTCTLPAVDFKTTLEVRLHPDDISQSKRSTLMRPIENFEIWPPYVQAGSFTALYLRSNSSAWTLGSGNHVKRIWRDVRSRDGTVRDVEYSWSVYYKVLHFFTKY